MNEIRWNDITKFTLQRIIDEYNADGKWWENLEGEKYSLGWIDVNDNINLIRSFKCNLHWHHNNILYNGDESSTYIAVNIYFDTLQTLFF